MILSGVARLGADAVVRYLADGQAVANLSLAFNYGKKGKDGYRPTTWVDASLWGKLAEALEQYLLKGKQVSVTCDDIRVETYQKREGGNGFSLRGNVRMIELVGSAPDREGDAQPRPDPAKPSAQDARDYQRGKDGDEPPTTPAGKPGAFDDFEDDIPF